MIAVCGAGVVSGCLRVGETAADDGSEPTDEPEESENEAAGNGSESADDDSVEGSEPSSDESDEITSLDLTPAWDLDLRFRDVFAADSTFVGRFRLDTLVRLDPDGTVSWNTDDLSDAYGIQLDPTGTVYEEAIYAGTSGQAGDADNARLYAFDPNSGDVQWTDETATNGTRDLIDHYTRIDDCVVYGGQSGGTDNEQDSVVRALDAETGDELWDDELGTRFVVGLEGYDGRAFVGTTDEIIVYDAETGTEEGTIELTLGFSGVTYADETLYAYERVNETVTAVDANDYETLWQTESMTEPLGPSIGDTRFYVGDPAGFVRAYDRSTGERHWESPIDGSVATAPIPDGDRVWAGSDRGEVIAFAADTGDLLYKDRFDDEEVAFGVIDDVLLTDAKRTGYEIREE
ncbi:PQQ-binding-like beta-propeller repeat protein [Halorubrum rubrum]|uniref:PQQ-binding-like beta-propeller repeat protein n=1 Tax=Halorubrum rubrum TaxID=1126240 RepID=UPI002112C806|nr:PQQ-binding-like beta-propeller repeat protein [Halorubrum rubrum]